MLLANAHCSQTKASPQLKPLQLVGSNSTRHMSHAWLVTGRSEHAPAARDGSRRFLRWSCCGPLASQQTHEARQGGTRKETELCRVRAASGPFCGEQVICA